MPHQGAAIPNVTFAANVHYHHLTNDVMEGGKLPYRPGRITGSDGPGFDVRLDRQKLRRYADLYQELGGYTNDRDPGCPDWYALAPNEHWVAATVRLTPALRASIKTVERGLRPAGA